jgi:hypothetical protein
MPLVELKKDATLGELRTFGCVWAPLTFVLLAWARGGETGWELAVAAVAAFMAIAWVKPRWLKPVYLAWRGLAFPLAWLTAHMVLAAVFFLLITPIGWILRAVGYDPLARQFDREAQSYWTPRPPDNDPQRSFRPY